MTRAGVWGLHQAESPLGPVLPAAVRAGPQRSQGGGLGSALPLGGAPASGQCEAAARKSRPGFKVCGRGTLNPVSTTC